MKRLILIVLVVVSLLVTACDTELVHSANDGHDHSGDAHDNSELDGHESHDHDGDGIEDHSAEEHNLMGEH